MTFPWKAEQGEGERGAAKNDANEVDDPRLVGGAGGAGICGNGVP